MNTEREIIEWITAEVEGVSATVDPDTPLLSSGLLDSLKLMSLIEFAEEKFGIRLSEEDMHPNNFQTPRAMASLVDQRMTEQRA